MHKNIKVLGAIAVAGVVATTGSAFTASNSIAASVAGFGTSTITGATASSVVYGLSADGKSINTADLVFSGDLTGRTVKAGFGGDALEGTCTVGTYNTTTLKTPVACTGFTAVNNTTTTFDVAVS